MLVLERRRALTLIELIVVVFVVGVLLALLMPAVHSARESARRVHCASQMKGIGIALHQHVATHGAFPAGLGERGLESYLVHLLPYVDQPLYDSLDIASGRNGLVNSADGKAIFHPPPTFRCPSDLPSLGSLALVAASYPANAGENAVKGSGPFVHQPMRPQNITDGLSQTVGVAEWVVGPGTIRVPGWPDRGHRLGSVHGIEHAPQAGGHRQFVRLCDSLPPGRSAALFPGFKGKYWTIGGLGATQYNHELPPNHPSCASTYTSTDVISAGSFHPGGANALSMDGSVRFVKESIDPRVWAAVGSRSGGEVVDGPARD